MDKTDIKRTSALGKYYVKGHYGNEGSSNIIFEEIKPLVLFQIAFWPDTVSELETVLNNTLGTKEIPKPGSSISNSNISVLRVEPFKIWVRGVLEESVCNENTPILDLSHSRTNLLISGKDTTNLLNRFLPIDLRENSFGIGAVASTMFHHVGVTLWRTEDGYQLFLPRGFSLSLFELLLQGAEQFGLEIK
ncbi:hypothetical protein OAR29_03020 [Rhodospirillales bacterium]|nr:hypothetical protein [Rhodospirillales bacterium]